MVYFQIHEAKSCLRVEDHRRIHVLRDGSRAGHYSNLPIDVVHIIY